MIAARYLGTLGNLLISYADPLVLRIITYLNIINYLWMPQDMSRFKLLLHVHALYIAGFEIYLTFLVKKWLLYGYFNYFRLEIAHC